MSDESQLEPSTETIEYQPVEQLHILDMLVRRGQIKSGEIKWWNELLEWSMITFVFIVLALAYSFFNNWGNTKEFCIQLVEFRDKFAIIFAVLIIIIKIYLNVFRNLQSTLLKKEKLLFENVNAQLISKIDLINDKVEKISDQVDGYLNKAKIVFETGIKDYDDNHLGALKKILNSLEGKDVKDIYAIDNTEPIQWWSETMTGYMALLSNWKAKKSERQVHRIFVFTKNELLSPIVTKTLTLHSLMGLKTYIISKEKFDKVYTEFSKSFSEKTRIEKKEVLIWEEPTTHLANCVIASNNKWSNITCYQSFWDMNMPKEKRSSSINDMEFEWTSYGKDSKIKSKDISVWFEFIPYSSLQKKNENWLDMPMQYINFIKLIISKSVCCNDENDLNSHSGNFAIEIKTDCQDNNGFTFEFTTNKAIKSILTKYSTM